MGCFLAGGFWINLDGVVWCFDWLFLLCVGLHNITFSVLCWFLSGGFGYMVAVLVGLWRLGV